MAPLYDTSIILQFTVATMLPVVAAVVLAILERHTRFGELPYWPKQVLCGALFGAIAIYGTERGIDTHGATMNVRDAAPLTAGLLFGGPAGVIAGVIGGVERWFAALWGRGMFSRLGCSIGTIVAGVTAALSHRMLFEEERPRWTLAFAVGVVVEVFHLLLIFVTNLGDPTHAFLVVQTCNAPMVACNALSVALATEAVALVHGEMPFQKSELAGVSLEVRRGLLAAALIGFAASLWFVMLLMTNLTRVTTLETLSNELDETTTDVLDAVDYKLDEESTTVLIQSILSNHLVGNNGFLVVLTKEGKVVGAYHGVYVSEKDALGLLDAAQTESKGDMFDYVFGGQPYFCMRRSVSGYQVCALLPVSEAETSRDLMVLITIYMEVILLGVIFAVNYVLIRHVVVRSIWRVNDRLEQITRGDLSVEVDVRGSSEFSALSDGINDTVESLREAIAAEGKRIESDLATAKAIQESALPNTFPPFPDIDAFDIYASMNAAREVGGDFYDFFTVDDHTLGFLIADVSGKGIPASLFMMEAKADLANYMKSGMELREAVRMANWNLCQGNESDMFVTVWAAMLDYRTGELTYVNAGHNYPLLRRNGVWEWIKVRCGAFLGAFETAKFRQETIVLEPGDQLLLYTDGVNEAMNVNEEQYGNDRLEAFLAAHATFSARMLVESLLADVRRWATGAEQSDDITILSLEYGVPPELAGALTVPATEDGLKELEYRLREMLLWTQCPEPVRQQLYHVLRDLFYGVCVQGYVEDEGASGQVRLDDLFDAASSTITLSLTYWGAPPEVEVYDLPLSSEVDDIAYVDGGDHHVIAFKKSW